jgi:hypothetical protein
MQRDYALFIGFLRPWNRISAPTFRVQADQKNVNRYSKQKKHIPYGIELNKFIYAGDVIKKMPFFQTARQDRGRTPRGQIKIFTCNISEKNV